MGIFTKKLILNFFLYFFLFFIFFFQKINSENLDFAKKEFLLGNYENAIDISSKLHDLDSKIFQARAISVYAHFFLKDEVAKNKFLEQLTSANENVVLSTSKLLYYLLLLFLIHSMSFHFPNSLRIWCRIISNRTSGTLTNKFCRLQ